MEALSIMIKPSSGLCNMSCDYCFYCDEAKKRMQESYGFMEESTLKNIIRKTMLHRVKAVSYVFQGGEPTLRGLNFFRKAIEYQKQYYKNEMVVNNALQTNGYGLDENWCQFLKEHNFLVGISIDGVKETHDTYRHDKLGNGTYDQIIKATLLMDRFQVDYNIVTVVNHNVAIHIKEIYKDYKKRGWKYQQYIACLNPLGEEPEQKEYTLSAEIYGTFLIELFSLWYEDWKKGDQPYIRQFENYIMLLAGYKAEVCDQNGRCGIQYVVEADGSVYPCDFYMVDEYQIGNFNNQQIDVMNENRDSLGFVERSMKLEEKCKECQHYFLCKGGCQRQRVFDMNSGLYKNCLCESYQRFFDVCKEYMVEMALTLFDGR